MKGSVSGFFLLLAFGMSQPGWGVSAPLLERMKFTSVELLIYTDQLQRFERTACSANVVSSYVVAEAQQQLLSQLKPEHRAEFEQLFGSAQVRLLRQENKAGVEALLGSPQLLGGDKNLDAQQRVACQELGELFEENYLQTRRDLQQLFDQYQH